MKLVAIYFAVCLPLCGAMGDSPVSKVLQLLSDMQTKILGEGEAAHKAYAETTEWCEERSKNLGFEIKTSKSEIDSLKASIEEETALAASLTSKVEELAAGISTDEADLKAATDIRTKEAADFAASEKELMDVIDTLHRAIGILEKEMAKGGASMVQFQSANQIAQVMDILVQSSELRSADAGRLTALLQSSQESRENDGEDSLGAPAAATYEGHSNGIIDTMEGLLEKAEAQLDAARKKETADAHNYAMLKQSLEDEIKFAQKDMAKAKKGIAQSSEKKSTAQGDLEVTSADFKEDTTSLADLHQTCMTKAQDYEAETKSRGEELEALAVAKKALTDNTAGAASLSYGLAQTSLLQMTRSRMSTGVDLANFEAVHFVRNLARKQKSSALAQLASRMASAMRFGARSGDDPFGKVKGLITDMISKLEDEAQQDASHKAYCDKEMSETHTKKDDKTDEIEKLATKIDQMTARSQQLQAEVASLQKALSELAKTTAEMDKLRKDEQEAYTKNKADMEQGLQGVKLALKVLREYYGKTDKAHSAGEGAGASIIGLLEVVESDFSKGLAEMTATEESSQSTYETETKENEIEKTTKEQDVKYKTKEATSLDKATAEATSDKNSVQSELDAVLEYLTSLEKECVAKAETYEERKARFEAELSGLKEALQILESETAALIQKASSRRILRISRPSKK